MGPLEIKEGQEVLWTLWTTDWDLSRSEVRGGQNGPLRGRRGPNKSTKPLDRLGPMEVKEGQRRPGWALCGSVRVKLPSKPLDKLGLLEFGRSECKSR